MREVTHFHRLRSSRMKIFYMISAAIFAYLIGGLSYRQVIQHEYFLRKENRQNLRRIVLPGTRGNIYDRGGILLAGHKDSYSANLYLHELEDEFRGEYLRSVHAMRDANIPFDGKELRLKTREAVVMKYVATVNQIIGTTLRISAKEIEKHLAQKFLLPMKILENISQKDYEKLLYALPESYPLQLTIDEVRHYPYGALACHLIGYVSIGEQSNNICDDLGKIKTFALKGQIGKTGVEFIRDDTLHGTPGYALCQVDTLGRHRELLKSEQPRHGSSVMLSIDKNLQSVVEKVLGDSRGCAIVIDVRTGEVLAMASKPSYDLNLLIPRLSNDAYQQITESFGWLNLATQGKFPPGSPFKLVSSVAFLKSGEVLRSDSVFCNGGIEIGGNKFPCNGHSASGPVTFGDALSSGCNTFFYENALRVDRDRLINVTMELGFSEKTGLELPFEASGLVPTEPWKKNRGLANWTSGDTLNLAIGHGYLLVTPLEMCCFTASIAKNRLRTKPTIFLNGNNGNLPDDRDLGLDVDDHRFLVDVMVAMIGNKLGKCEKEEDWKIAGATGVTQFFESGGKKPLAWVTAFAPAKAPEIAVTVAILGKSMEDGPATGSESERITGRIFAAFFKEL